MWVRGTAAALAALLLAGCTGGAGSSGGGSVAGAGGDTSTSRLAGPEMAKPAKPGDAGAPTPGPSAKDNQSRGSSGESSARRRAKLPELAPQDRDIIYTATLTVRTGDVLAAISEAERIVRGAGGFVHSEHVSTDRDSTGGGSGGGSSDGSSDGSSGNERAGRTTATLTLKVPPDRFHDVMDRLAGDLGTLLEREQNAKDVTEKVADVESRIASAKASIERLRTLLGEADTVGEVLEVEEKLAAREAELESLQARADALAEKTSYGTITVELHEPESAAAPPPPGKGPTGFLGGLFAGWGAFTAVVAWLLTALGTTLPFLVALMLLGAAAWWVRGLVRQRTTPEPDES